MKREIAGWREAKRCADLALLEKSRKADHPHGSCEGRTGVYGKATAATRRPFHLDRDLHCTRAGAIAAAPPYAEQGRSFVDLGQGNFYREADRKARDQEAADTGPTLYGTRQRLR